MIRLAPLAYKAGTLIRQKEIVRVTREYSIVVKRRLTLGADGGISQMVQIMRKGKLQEVWHMVVRGGRIIHKDKK